MLNPVGILIYVVLGLVAGFIASKLLKQTHGLLGTLVAGVAGSILGPILFNALGFQDQGNGGASFLFALVSSVIGAVIVLLVWSRLVKR